MFASSAHTVRTSESLSLVLGSNYGKKLKPNADDPDENTQANRYVPPQACLVRSLLGTRIVSCIQFAVHLSRKNNGYDSDGKAAATDCRNNSFHEMVRNIGPWTSLAHLSWSRF